MAEKFPNSMKKCESVHSEISMNSMQDQGREGHSQVQCIKNAGKDKEILFKAAIEKQPITRESQKD